MREPKICSKCRHRSSYDDCGGTPRECARMKATLRRRSKAEAARTGEPVESIEARWEAEDEAIIIREMGAMAEFYEAMEP